MTEIILATNNANKVREIKAILGGRFEIKTLAQAGIEIDVEETGTTFAENAYIKAYEVAKLTGKPALSDDSGLEVEALGGAPGIFSARYAGKEQNDKANIKKLLSVMEGEQNRKARFVSSVCLCYPDGSFVSAEGEVKGEILLEERGTNGFGYDPVFFCYELGKSLGEAESAEKNLVSHRKRALENLAAKLGV